MINLALIGAGQWGKNYLRAIKSLPDARIKYVCSGESSLSKLPSSYVKLNAYKILINKEDLDGVIIAVPAVEHFEITKFFMSVGKPILVEKPMTASLEEAEKLKTIYEKNKGKIMVGNIFLYNEAFKEFVKLFRKIDNVCYLNFEGCDWGPQRKDVSALWDWGPHDVSMCLELLGKPIKTCAWAIKSSGSVINQYDMVYARLFFKDGVSAFLKMGWLSPVKKREILAVGQDESLLFDDLSNKKIIHFDKLSNKESINLSIKNEPLVNELQDFIEMIRSNVPFNDFNRNFTIIKVLDSMEKSIKNNGSIEEIE